MLVREIDPSEREGTCELVETWERLQARLFHRDGATPRYRSAQPDQRRHHWFSGPGWVGGVYITPTSAGDEVSHDDFALMCLTGPEAQARVEHRIVGGALDRVRRRVYAENSRGEAADMVSVAEVIGECTFSLRKAQRLVQGLVDDLWPFVQSIAAALREDGYLTARQIRRVA